MRTIYSFLLYFVFHLGIAQPILRLEEALDIALQNNFDIVLAKNNATIASTRNDAGNAGMLPNIMLNVNDINSITNTNQIQGGTERTLNNAKNLVLNYGVALDWTVFDGLRMFARKEQLKKLEAQGKAALQSAILTRVGDIYVAYYDLVQRQQQIKVVDTAIALSKARYTVAENRYKIGKASKLEVLNAQVDLNTDESLQVRQKEQYKAAKINLNVLMARAPELDFQVEESVILEENIDLAAHISLAKSQNPQLIALMLAKNSAELQLKQIRAGRYPTIRVNTGYNIQRTEASLGFITQSQSQGFTYGFSASMPIFQGNQISRDERIAKLEIENAKLTVAQQELLIVGQLQSAYESYLAQKSLATIEANNVTLAAQNLDITLAKFKIGTLTPIEYRSAQQQYIEAKIRHSNALFQAKIFETTLKELSGTLRF
ncbi:MAG: TolC family protein [Flavobacterium sp.]|jgi:outer membrane protein|uniref:TolC family protein n=2 Tax=Flavobacterium sp. TaxID=239 RepID=UPI0022BDE66B|nr:TolC family protein [Flavobacterium sp.]MCZ8169078.1 TolC family protein [Flavobacterium sp.]MCZ8297143.1 TolC family protein [Flavobacterium sp.]